MACILTCQESLSPPAKRIKCSRASDRDTQTGHVTETSTSPDHLSLLRKIGAGTCARPRLHSRKRIRRGEEPTVSLS